MTQVRRLVGAGAILVLAVVITCTFVLGDPSRDKQRYHPGDNDAAPVRVGLPEVASSKFADQPVITYNASDGVKYFAAQIFAKGVSADRRPRDILILVDTSAGQALGSLPVAKNLVATIAGKAGAEDQIALWTVSNEV